ncbi:hypothetical protein KBZ14_07980 [Synechococcus sp. HJ21-Hayes]|uniref:hypothetical protein n=1 Tax=Synechococcus sp. HJ21-Hayes TaxID=2823736 RepID=UPI0020CCDA06|nr:hypothetical protein [Synechococcus sp. HJ21-Hayes]MCP9852809.1 hypothetical protein [Synechococcus sp. HJ21-Hayes]
MSQAPLTGGAPLPMAEPLPLDLLPPLEPSQQLATPNPPGGEQRSVLLLDDTSGKELDPLPSRLLIGKDGATRSIWPVHLAGWQSLGWQLLTPAPPSTPEPIDPDPVPTEPDPPAAEPVPVELKELLVELPPAPDPAAGEALLAEQAPDFQAMTKAEIVAFCSATYGVSLDGGMTKAELVEQATDLHANAGAEGTSLLELPDDLL